MKKNKIMILLTLIIAMVSVSTVSAQCVAAGIDSFASTAGDSPHSTADLDIPADFFGPGSDPFSGLVDLDNLDTAIERHAPMAQNPIDIELVALDLVSSGPITVTYNGGYTSEFWDVKIDISVPQSSGTITNSGNDCSAGTFDSSLPVQPRLTFTRVSDNATTQDVITSPFLVNDTGQTGPIPFNMIDLFGMPIPSSSGTLQQLRIVGYLTEGGGGGDEEVPEFIKTGVIAVMTLLVVWFLFVKRRE